MPNEFVVGAYKWRRASRGFAADAAAAARARVLSLANRKDNKTRFDESCGDATRGPGMRGGGNIPSSSWRKTAKINPRKTLKHCSTQSVRHLMIDLVILYLA